MLLWRVRGDARLKVFSKIEFGERKIRFYTKFIGIVLFWMKLIVSRIGMYVLCMCCVCFVCVLCMYCVYVLCVCVLYVCTCVFMYLIVIICQCLCLSYVCVCGEFPAK